MRIALVSQEYPPETAKGGIGTQTFLKAHGLAALGHEVHVISRNTKDKSSSRTDHGVQVTRVPGFEGRMQIFTEAADWLTYSGEVAVAVAALHAKSPFDVVDFPEWGAEGYVHLLNRTEWNRIPTVIHLHGPLVMFAHTMDWPELDSEFYRTGTMMEGTCVRLADAVFSSSQCSADWCAKHYEVNRQAIPVIHTGVDTELFSPRDVPRAARPTIIFAGKLARNKGVHLLADAAVRLANEFPGLQLRLLGRGEPKILDELKNLVQSANVPDLLDAPGFVDRAELPAHFSRAHVFAAPSEYEGGPGFVYLEAMACGLPVIACAGSGAAEVVRQNVNGLLVPPQNVEALTAALRLLLKDEASREKMGGFARRFVLAEADSRACIQKLEAFYAAVANRVKQNQSMP
ncbi:MAG TPA: glycosyltransferase family 4 protein [Verrucomicrobiae bacterium]|nr:glycosyltransferase family 4 protein [Verrucomicrobiae bacterium]